MTRRFKALVLHVEERLLNRPVGAAVHRQYGDPGFS